MNPNQPNHIPSNFTRPQAASRRIAKWGGKRMFSRPAKDAFDAARKLQKRSRRIARSRTVEQPLGASIPETSAGSDLVVSARDATVHHDWYQGLNGAAIDGHLRMVCNYANEWHQSTDPARNYTGVAAPGGPLAGGRPLFYVADVDNDGVPYANPSPEQFWLMRYIFVPVYTAPKREGGPGHVSLLVICPAIKTLEYFDSDNEPYDADYTYGLIGRIMQWMSTFLDNPTENYTNEPQFVPEEWQFRDSRSRQQMMPALQNSGPEDQMRAPADCGIYTVSQAQYMAFGYDYSQSEKQNWPSDCLETLQAAHRRYRITSDLTGEGLPAPFFTFFNPEFRLNHIKNHQYYPILDTPPVRVGKTWREYRRHPQFATLLTPTLRNRRSCYVDCRYKTWLVRHCRRNLRWYPLYTQQCGPDRTLRQFREWVESMDERRRSGTFIAKPFNEHGKRDTWPRNWILPRESATAAECKVLGLLSPLW